MKKLSYTALQKLLRKTRKQLRAEKRKSKINVHQKKQEQTIAVKNLHHLTCSVTVANIVYLQADHNTTNVFVAHDNNIEKYYSSYNLLHAMQLLPPDLFVRTHDSFAANIHFLKSITHGENMLLHLCMETEVPVSRRRKSAVLQFIKSFKQS